MRTMKKMLAGAVALTMALTMNVAVFAADNGGTATIKKDYVVENSANSTAPAGTFSFNIEKVSVTDAGEGINADNMPTPTVSDVSYEKGVSGKADITVTLPTYTNVGIYTYRITENTGNIAGVDYDENPVYLKVTVTRNEETGELECTTAFRKNDQSAEDKIGDTGDDGVAFTNTYSAGTLNVTKNVTGNLGDTEKYFEFTITLTGEEGKTYEDSYAITGGSNKENASSIAVGETATVYLKDDDTISIENLPYGVTYTVTEEQTEGYVTTKTGDNGTINAATQAASFTNNKGSKIDTGITTDNLPYFLIAAGVVAGAVVLITRKRRYDD